MFKNRKRGSKKFEAARQARAVQRLESSAPDYPQQLPELRRSIIVIDHDFGDVEHRIDLYRSNRIDCYKVVIDGQRIHGRMGWSAVLDLARKAFVRVGSPTRS